ncbi:solute carrier family 35 member B1 homolog meigo [Leptinotarsa decemlineata]|uniref:solute carrier family 35 member B1 homolog meigo n=1 Tax=Leptinotarsa decemlineata TaxID=7539 RepID=UPI003D30842E
MHKNKFFLYAGGIFLSYFYFGIVQEKITRGKYPYEVVEQDGTVSTKYEKYTFALTLVFVQCVVNFLVAKVSQTIWPQGEDKTHKLYYASMSVTYLLAMVCSNMALQWVSYPTQVVGKSAKPIPVMILGVLLGKKIYTARKYLFVFMIVFGIVLFMLKDQAKTSTQDSTLGVGELLLVLSLLMDGLTGAIQDRIRAESKPTGLQMMQVANAWCTLFLAVTILITGEYAAFFEFAKRFPFVVNNLLILGVTSSIGQLFLYSMVSEFGPLVLSVVTTTRKFFTVLASVLLFGNALSARQWTGTIIVFAALFLDAFYSKTTPKKK